MVFLDPYGKDGAHPALNKTLIDVMSKGEGKTVFFGGVLPDSVGFFLVLNCVLLFVVALFYGVFTGRVIVLLAWPNKMVWSVNVLSFLFGCERISMVIHNNIMRAKEAKKRIKINCTSVFLDSGLVDAALPFLECRNQRVFPHPFFEYKLKPDGGLKGFDESVRDSSGSIIRGLVYEFGSGNNEFSTSVEDFIASRFWSVWYRGGTGSSSFDDLPRLSSYHEYRTQISLMDFLVVLPVSSYRISATGFVLDAIGSNVSVFVPDDISLAFDSVRRTDYENHLVRYCSLEQLENELYKHLEERGKLCRIGD